jgi:predicted dehydrogenase
MSPGYGFHMSYTVNFENATADYDIVRAPTDMLKLFRPGHPPEVIKCEGADGYVQELQHIFHSIRSGVPPTVVTMEDGLAAIQICEAEEKSIRTKAPVDLA